jgi:hypothetical protein
LVAIVRQRTTVEIRPTPGDGHEYRWLEKNFCEFFGADSRRPCLAWERRPDAAVAALKGRDCSVCELACLQASSASDSRSLPFSAACHKVPAQQQNICDKIAIRQGRSPQRNTAELQPESTSPAERLLGSRNSNVHAGRYATVKDLGVQISVHDLLPNSEYVRPNLKMQLVLPEFGTFPQRIRCRVAGFFRVG